MAIDHFTKEDFETYLTSNHSPFEYAGLDKGEHTYSLSLDNQVSITIRSSIKSDGLSADVGKDSIRCWLVNKDNKSLGSKLSKWTTRVSGWQERLTKNIDTFVFWRTLAGDCKECGKAKGIFKAKTLANKGRPFARCKEHKDSFQWLDEKINKSDIYFSDESHNSMPDEQHRRDDNDTSEATNTKDEMAHNRQPVNDTLQSGSTGKIHANAAEISRSVPDMPELSRGPNEAQRSAIEANVNSDLRVLAGPGSGKTFVIALRYEYLVNNDVSPQNILVCTFGKEASLEMAKRIQKLIPSANLETICTINALCSRLLTKWDSTSRWFGWKMPKKWQIKKTLEEVIGPIWQEKEKPGAKKTLKYINTSKALGLTTDDSYQWFVDVLGQQYGEWLYDIRSKFDAWLNRNRFITYADQLYLIEKKLQSNEVWRTGLQERFSHVIIDEAQDTSYQAMRILITISLEPGKNTVYEVKQ